MIQGVPSSGQSVTYLGFPSQQAGGLYFTLIFVAVIVALRLYRGIDGRRYSNIRVLRLPVIYSLLTLFTVLAVSLIDNLIIATLAFIPAGAIAGYRFGSNVKFFMKNSSVYYARSPVVMVLWLASFIARYILEFAYPGNLTVILVVDSVLSLTTGLLIGEAVNIMQRRKEFKETAPSAEHELDSFKINT